jgi:putative tricarboxylic transport membrane protein
MIRNPKDFWSGVMFVAVGALAVLVARDYPMGSALRMGPAYFPTVLGVLLTLVGAAAMVRGVTRPGAALGRFAWRDLLLILSSTILFGILIRGAGLIAAVATIVLVGAYASTRFRWGYALLLAFGMAAFCALLFIKALGLPIPMIGPWFGY